MAGEVNVVDEGEPAPGRAAVPELDEETLADLDDRASRDPLFSLAFRGASGRRHLLRTLAELRRDMCVSQQGLASEMGTTQSAVARFEAGLADPRLSTLERYAAALGQLIEWRLPVMSEEAVLVGTAMSELKELDEETLAHLSDRDRASQDPHYFWLVHQATYQRRLRLRGLAACRHAMGMSQQGLASEMGTTQSAVARFEAGLADPKASTLERYAAALGLWLEWRLPVYALQGKAKRARTTRPRPARPSTD